MSAPDHTRHAPRPLREIVAEIRHLLAELGYSEREINCAVAGGVIFGHIRPGGALWYLEHVIEHHLRPAHPMDDLLEAKAAQASRF